MRGISPKTNEINYTFTCYLMKIELEKTCDFLRDCRKSPKRAILAILYAMKSTGYEHQNHKFRVFLTVSAMITQIGQSVIFLMGIT